MVAGYHNCADAGGLALVDSVLNLRTHGVDHARKAHKTELLLKRLRLAVVRLRFPYAQSTGQNSQGLIGHCLIIIEYLTAVVIGHWNGLAVFEIVRAFSDDNVGCALCVLNHTVRGKVQSTHHFSAGVKRRFAAAWKRFLQRGFIKPQRVCPCNQRGLRRLAGHGSLIVYLGVAAQRHCLGKLLLVFAEEIDNGHPVLRQRACFIRANDLRAAKRFDRRQAADYRVAL